MFSGDPMEPGVGTGESVNGGKINEVVLCWGIGSGKSFMTSLAAAYVLYRLGCMRDPAVGLGLAPGSEIVVTNVSVSEDQARRVIFGEIGRRVQAPWFREHFAPLPRVKSELRFPKGVRVFPGNSTSDKVLGLNVIMGIIDEAAFHGEISNSEKAYMTADSSDSYSGAVELYYALQQRAQSRFGQNWLLLMVSSPLFVGDFIQRKLREYALGAPGMLGHHAAQWEVKPPESYSSGAHFWFNPMTREIRDEPPEDWDGELQYWDGADPPPE